MRPLCLWLLAFLAACPTAPNDDDATGDDDDASADDDDSTADDDDATGDDDDATGDDDDATGDDDDATGDDDDSAPSLVSGGSFETGLPSDGTSQTMPAGWTWTGWGSGGVMHPSAGNFSSADPLPAPADGNEMAVASFQGGGTSGSLVLASPYLGTMALDQRLTIHVALGDFTGAPTPGHTEIAIVADETADGLVRRRVLASQVVTPLQLIDYEFTAFSVSYDVTDADVGIDFAFVLSTFDSQAEGGVLGIDAVRLEIGVGAGDPGDENPGAVPTLRDPSFEGLPIPVTRAVFAATDPGWVVTTTGVGLGNISQWRPGPTSYTAANPLAAPAAGSQALNITFNPTGTVTLTQPVAIMEAGMTYTVTVALGRQNGRDPISTFNLGFSSRAAGTADASSDVELVGSAGGSTIEQAYFSDASFSYAATAGDAGAQLVLILHATGDYNEAVDIDNIRLAVGPST